MDRQQRNMRIVIGAGLVLLGLAGCMLFGVMVTRIVGSVGGAANSPASLTFGDKQTYTVLIASGYAWDHDLESAQVRLEQLDVPNTKLWVASLIDDFLSTGQDSPELGALMQLAHGLGADSPVVLAYMTTLTPPPTNTPLPPTDTPTPQPTGTPTPRPTNTPVPPTEEPPTETAVAPTEAPPTETAVPPTEAPPTDTPKPTNPPKPTNTPQPTSPPAAKWTSTEQLVGPGIDGQSCNEGLKLIRVTVVDAGGSQIPGVWVYERYTNQYRVTGHKGDDPFWGPGEAEFMGLDGGQLCIATGDGGPCESDFTRSLPCHDPPEFEDLWAAGYCEYCDPGITKERCQQLVEEGKFLGVGHYAWRVVFQRSQ